MKDDITFIKVILFVIVLMIGCHFWLTLSYVAEGSKDKKNSAIENVLLKAENKRLTGYVLSRDYVDSMRKVKVRMTNPNSIKILEAEKRFQSKTKEEIKASPLRAIK